MQKLPTEVTKTFWRLPLGRIEDLIIGGQYDDIFDKILFWRTYYKEPFHNYKHGLNIRSVDEYTSALFIKKFYDVIETFYDEFTGRNFRTIWQSAVKFFSKEENICQFIQHKKKERAAKRERIERGARHRESKIYIEKDKKRRTKIHEENRIKKLTSAKCGQKQKIIVLEMLDGKVYENAAAAGNRVAWLCLCGVKTPLIGRTYGVIPQSDSVVVCKNCNRHYYLCPFNGKAHKPPEKIIEISLNYDFKK